MRISFGRRAFLLAGSAFVCLRLGLKAVKYCLKCERQCREITRRLSFLLRQLGRVAATALKHM